MRDTSFTAFAAACHALWGAGWESEFCAVADYSPRQVARWRKDGRVTNGPVWAMLDAFNRLGIYRLEIPTAANRFPS